MNLFFRYDAFFNFHFFVFHLRIKNPEAGFFIDISFHEKDARIFYDKANIYHKDKDTQSHSLGMHLEVVEE